MAKSYWHGRKRQSLPAGVRRRAARRTTRLLVEQLESRSLLAPIVVTTAADEDNGSPDPALGNGTSLREAIQWANASPGADDIAFNIPGAGPHTIAPLSPLPAITQPVSIDGYTQPGASVNTLSGDNDAVILIELDGANAGNQADGLVLTGGGSTIRGLAIGRFDGRGIRVESDNNIIAGNFIGTDATGTLDRGNGEGVTLVGAEEGDAGAPLYSNDFEGSVGGEWSSTTTDVTPVGNRRFLGQFGNDTPTLTINADDIDQDHTTAITVEFDLFVIRTWDGNHTGSGSGPDRWGLKLGNGMSLLDTTFSNNHPNSGFAGQAYPGVFGSGQFEPQTGASEVNTLGFLVGNDEFDSVYHLSFTFSYTGGDLVLKFGAGLTTPGEDESWGLDNVEVRAIADAASAPNDYSLASNPNGDWTYGWTSTLGGTLHPYPDSFTTNGLQIWIDNAIASLGAPSTAYNPTPLPAAGCCTIQPGQLTFHPGPNAEQSVVRWTAPADGTIDVAGFFVGIDGSPTTTDVHVLHNGVLLFDGIVNRLYAGPYYQTTLAIQAGDTIDFAVGTGGNGFISDSTALDAVISSSSSGGASGGAAEGNVIGGTSPADQNILAHSGGDGIRTTNENAAAAIVGNSIFGNGASGIDLSEEDPPAPDFVLTSFPGELRVDGTLDALPGNQYRLEFFANDSPDPSGAGEGQRLIGVRRVQSDSSGHLDFIHELPPVADGRWITATATLIAGNGETLLETSEFSEAVQANSEQAGADLAVTITDSPDPVFLGDSVTYTVNVTNHGPDAATGVIIVASGPVGQPFNNVTIPLGGLANGASSSFQLAFTPAALGTFSATATVMASEDDPNPANNSFTETTLVKSGVTFELAQAQYEVREGEEFAVLTVRRTGSLASGASVDFETVNGTAAQRGIRDGIVRVDDFTATSGTLFFKARSNVATIRVPIIDDSRLESDETFRVVLSNPSGDAELGPISSSTVVIHDNDPTLSFVASSSERGEAIGGRGSIEVRLSPASNRTVTVNYAAAGGSATLGADYSLIGRTLTFHPGETRKFIQFSNVNDTLFEGDETAILELSSPTNAFLGTQTRYRVTIVDDDPEPPPVDPGSTPAAALFIDLQTLPRQVYAQTLGRADVDVFRVHLNAGENLALDVDPGSTRFAPSGLTASTLTVIGADMTRVIATVGRSVEPDTGVFTDNPACLLHADASGDYYLKLQTNQSSTRGYQFWFQRLGVAEHVPAPELLNAGGAMYAWFDGSHTVGITGPTGYGFTLDGPWQQQVTNVGRVGLKSEVLNLPVGSQFTLNSPQGVSLPLIASQAITIATKQNRWGNLVGEVTTSAINFPVALGIAPINQLLSDVFGSDIVAVGLLSGDWRISLGGKTLAVNGRNTTSDIGALLAGVPYLRQRGPIALNAQLGPFSLNYAVADKPVEWAFDPADPMLYLKTDEISGVKQPTLAVSLHGLLEYKPQAAPDPQIDAGVTQFYGHILMTGQFPFKIGPIPLRADAEEVINVDANRDGRPLGDLRDVHEVFDVLDGDFSEVREILDDVQIGVNGKLTAVFKEHTFEVELGRASAVLNGLTESIWVRGQQGGANPLAGTPLAQFNTGTTTILEGLISWDGTFLFTTQTTYDEGPAEFTYRITISNLGIFAHVEGKAEFSVHIDTPAGSVKGKAVATLAGDLNVEVDDDGDIHLSGSISASGKLVASGNTLFSGSIEANVRSKGFRFKFPKGVGSIDLNLI